MIRDQIPHPLEDLATGSPDVDGRLGRRRFLVGVGAAAGAASFTSLLPAGDAQAVSVPAGASVFSPLPKAVRLADTRPSKGNYPRISPNLVRVKVRDIPGVPSTASAVVLTVTGVSIGDTRYVTVYPTGKTRPVVSNLNMVRGPGEVTANMVTVKVGDHDSVDIFQLNPCHVIVDLMGYYAPVTSATRDGRFVVLGSARRALDTRKTFGYAASGSFTWVDLTPIDPDLEHASSVVINLTATQCTGRGFFSALPASADESKAPSTSSLNVMSAGETRAGQAIVPISTDGSGRRRIKIYTSSAAKLIVDVNGYYTSTTSPLSTDGLFVPVDPVRVLDTRWPGAIGKLWPAWVVRAKVPGDAANGSAVILNVTGVKARGKGYLTVSGALQQIPLTSNLNLTGPGATVPNHVYTPITATYGFQVFSSSGAHVLADLAGYFTGRPLTAQFGYTNPPPPAAPPPWVVRIPRLGLTSNVYDGDPIDVTDSGHTWHWTGTGQMGQTAHVAVFGHRTEHGGPYRYLHTMVVGDTWTVTTADNREYTYRMVRRDLSDAQSANILQATRNHPGTTMSFIACTVGFDSSKSAYPDYWAPTSLKYRIVVTGELVSWREL